MPYRVPSTPITITHIGSSVYEICRRSSGEFLGLIRQTPNGGWRAQGKDFASAGEAADATIADWESANHLFR